MLPSDPHLRPKADADLATPPPVAVLRPRLPHADSLLPYLRRLDANRMYSNHGPLAVEFELRIAERLGLPPGAFASASSGAAALVGAILATAGRATSARPLALVPDYTFVATALAAEECGYAPFVADVDPRTWMLDPARLRSLPELDRVGLVIPVSPYGRALPQAPWQAFRAATGIPVVIDAAAAVEAIAADPAATLGPVPVMLSFHATKALACGEGGGVACTDAATLHASARALNFGFWNSRDCTTASINGKMSEYHAAVGLAELDHWDTKRAGFAAAHAAYGRRMAAAGLRDRYLGAPTLASCYALLQCADAGEAARVEASLADAGVGWRRWYGNGIASQTHFAGASRESLAVSRNLSATHLGLPMSCDLDDASVERVVAAVAAGLGMNA